MLRLITSLTFTLVTMFSAISSANPDSACSADSPLMATYQIKTKGKPAGSRTLELWRDGNRVAIRYPEDRITEQWELTSNNRLHLVRYFDLHERGIEYQPNEIKGSHDWSLKRQLISDTLLKEMKLSKTRGKGCQSVAHYSKKSNGTKLKLKWLERQQLIKEFRVKRGNSVITWKLQQVNSDPQSVAQAFVELGRYDTTDYTDIGDNESDPFLLNMINLGFVERGASGFYDAQGNDMGDEHGHHH